MGRFCIFSHPCDIRRRRGFQDIGVDTFPTQHAVTANLLPIETDHLFKGVPESATKCRTFVEREVDQILGPDRETELSKSEIYLCLIHSMDTKQSVSVHYIKNLPSHQIFFKGHVFEKLGTN